MERQSERSDSVVGTAVVMGVVTGLAALLAAVFAFFSGLTNSDFVGAGVCLLAAALAFGLTANAVLRS